MSCLRRFLVVASSPWRDLHAVNMHGLLNLETNMELYGRVVPGGRPTCRRPDGSLNNN
jgi:hypothetical protein